MFITKKRERNKNPSYVIFNRFGARLSFNQNPSGWRPNPLFGLERILQIFNTIFKILEFTVYH